MDLNNMHSIPILEDSPEDLPANTPHFMANAQAILREAQSSFGVALRPLDYLARLWLRRNASPYLPELDALAAKFRLPGVYLLNLSYEWACTVSIFAEPDGSVRMLRAFDWGLKSLSSGLTAFRRSRGRFPYLALSWPLFVGEATIVAPGRFAIALNWAPPPPRGIFGQSVPDRLAAASDRLSFLVQNNTPASHLLRDIAENVATAREAIQRIADERTCKPSIFCVAGLSLDDSAVIEKNGSKTEIFPAPISAGNHWINITAKTNDPASSLARTAAIFSKSAPESIENWCTFPVLNERTRFAADIRLNSGIVDVVAVSGSRFVSNITRFELDTI
ncbi:hypothetical protein [Rhizobium rhizogenes]|uniref:hypothetical protein n=1 Tax=Rhizobium rhizogenes TaxID=359 RepID=UPI00157220A3|nr:hypothetical protein [Rhizobium rhizogenes]NTG05518.1 hypothetical protein [Rhizobium rhizogenes]NTG12118.1 hypothetical protein [Rhizobium rhizogenes]